MVDIGPLSHDEIVAAREANDWRIDDFRSVAKAISDLITRRGLRLSIAEIETMLAVAWLAAGRIEEGSGTSITVDQHRWLAGMPWFAAMPMYVRRMRLTSADGLLPVGGSDALIVWAGLPGRVAFKFSTEGGKLTGLVALLATDDERPSGLDSRRDSAGVSVLGE
jgi:hypothetical protein